MPGHGFGLCVLSPRSQKEFSWNVGTRALVQILQEMEKAFKTP
jgi:hypothetical protein